MQFSDWRSYPLPASFVLALVVGFVWINDRFVHAADFSQHSAFQQQQITELQIGQLINNRNSLQNQEFDLKFRLRGVEPVDRHPDDAKRLAQLLQEIADLQKKIDSLRDKSE